jgi:general secretion pathway protein E
LPAIQELAQCSLTGIRLAIASTATLDHLENQNTLSNPVQSAPNSHLSSPAIESASDAVAFVQKALETAFQEGASDVHFECDRAGIRTKFRLDGVMSPGTAAPSVGFAEQVISRIKVLSSLDITERRKPQDGRFRWSSLSGKATDIRVSIMPSIFGEDAVLRLLDRAQLRDDRVGINLSTLGFDSSTAKSIRSLATRPHGMLLVTGPTGSGKTTTVYAALSETSNDTEKIITIEDPVEYELPGVLQIPVNEQKGLTFATGLRSILRHDPDKILVGEIRDPETAEISIQAALTGHLVFTTVHANSLFDVLGRFQHFGVDPFALASALNGVLIQRLLRQLCRECKDASPETDTGLHVGCPACRHTGYKGRLVVSEVLALDNTLRDLIINRATISELTRHLELKGHVPLLDIAMECVRKRLTTREEVERVIGMA